MEKKIRVNDQVPIMFHSLTHGNLELSGPKIATLGPKIAESGL